MSERRYSLRSRPGTAAAAPPSRPRDTAAIRQTQDAKKESLQLLLESPNVTKQELDAFLSKQKYPQYLLGFDLWAPAVGKWIRGKKMPLVDFYLSTYMAHVDNKLASADFIGTILEQLRDTDAVFLSSPAWDSVRAVINKGAKAPAWWDAHILSSLSHEIYVRRFIEAKWRVNMASLLENIDQLSDGLLGAVLHRMLDENDEYMWHYRFVTDIHVQLIQQLIAWLPKPTPRRRSEASKSVVHEPGKVQKMEQLLIALIRGKKAALAKQRKAFLLSPGEVDGPFVRFVHFCVHHDRTRILDAVAELLDMRRAENKKWLEAMFFTIVKPPPPDPLQAINDLEMRESAVHFVVTKYKINLNNIYLTLNSLQVASRASLPPSYRHMGMFQAFGLVERTENPSNLWMMKNIPLVAAAILFDNVRALKFLVALGASLDRCAFSLQDLTSNPEILKVFKPQTSASRIAKQWLRYSMHPDHPSMAQRTEQWKRDLNA